MAPRIRITGQDGLNEPFFSMEISAASLGRGGLSTLLQRLASRHLSDREIVAASLKKNARGYSGLLDVSKPHPDDRRYIWSAGDNPYYTATAVDDAA